MMHLRMVKTAFEESIEHWKKNVEAKHPNEVKLGASHCALCKLFVEDGCKKCPIFLETGEAYCHSTPYYHVYTSFREWENVFFYPDKDEDVAKEKYLKDAQNELEFLETLAEKWK